MVLCAPACCPGYGPENNHRLGPTIGGGNGLNPERSIHSGPQSKVPVLAIPVSHLNVPAIRQNRGPLAVFIFNVGFDVPGSVFSPRYCGSCVPEDSEPCLSHFITDFRGRKIWVVTNDSDHLHLAAHKGFDAHVAVKNYVEQWFPFRPFIE